MRDRSNEPGCAGLQRGGDPGIALGRLHRSVLHKSNHTASLKSRIGVMRSKSKCPSLNGLLKRIRTRRSRVDRVPLRHCLELQWLQGTASTPLPLFGNDGMIAAWVARELTQWYLTSSRRHRLESMLGCRQIHLYRLPIAKLLHRRGMSYQTICQLRLSNSMIKSLISCKLR